MCEKGECEMIDSTFGEYITKKRLNREISLRKMATMLDCSAAFLSDVEKNRRKPLDMERLEKLADILELSENERTKMFDLAGKERVIAPDLPDYINNHGYVRCALRKARDLGAGEEEWNKFIAALEEKNNRKQGG